MKNINDLRYLVDAVTTLIEDKEWNYQLWFDEHNRLIKTENGINEEITGEGKAQAIRVVLGREPYPYEK